MFLWSSGTKPLWPQGLGEHGVPLCQLYVPAGFSYTAAEYRGLGTLTGFRKTAGKCLDCMHFQALRMQQESALFVHVYQL